MKTKLSRKTKQVASALLTTLIICSILSLFVMYYLSLIDQQNFLNARSQTWNMAIAITEAGVEDGLQQLNNNYPTLGTDGWTYNGSTGYWLSNSLPGGNSYTAYIFVTNSLNPVVVARGYVTPPTLAHNQSSSMFAAQGLTPGPTTVTRAVQVTCAKKNPFTAAMVAKQTIDLHGNNVTTDSFDSSNTNKSTNGQYDPAKYKGDHGDVATDLSLVDSLNVGNANIYGQVHTGPGSPNNAVQIGPNGVIGTHAWAASNSGIEPSYWQQDANFTFPDTTFPNTTTYLSPTGGVVVSFSNYTAQSSTYPLSAPPGGVTTNTVIVNNSSTLPSPAPIGTTTNTTPTSSLTYPSAGTFLGAVTTTIVTTGPQSGRGTWYNYNLIASYNYPAPMYSYTSVVYSTNSYNQILWGSSDGSANNYVANSLPGQTLILGPNVVLALPNGLSGSENFTLSQGNNIVGGPFAPAAITVYSGGTSCAINGNAVINQPGYAADFIVYCAPSVTSFALNGNAGFTGVLVAPNVNISMNGGGNNTVDFIGCLMVNSITMNGHFNFHYDEALGSVAGNARFLITSWNEIK